MSLAGNYFSFLKTFEEPVKTIKIMPAIISFVTLLIVGGCTPRVEVMAPEKPITINLNVKIDHEVRVRVEKDLEELFEEESDLF